jgi:hypothetical protein
MEGTSYAHAEYSDPAVGEQKGDHEARARPSPASSPPKTFPDAQLIASYSNIEYESHFFPATSDEFVDGLRFGIIDPSLTANQQRPSNTPTIRGKCHLCSRDKEKVPISQERYNVFRN